MLGSLPGPPAETELLFVCVGRSVWCATTGVGGKDEFVSITLWYGCFSWSALVQQQQHVQETTNIAIFPISPQKVLDLADECAAFIVFYATGPIVLASGDEHLLGVGGHGAIDALLTLDVQARRSLSALTCWRWTGLDRGYWRRRKGNVDARGVAPAS
jgi:hypothetical protein